MNFEFTSLNSQKNLIDGVVLHKLIVHRDDSGTLMEALRSDWQDVFFGPNAQFNQSYYSITAPGIARDENQWHFHPTKQSDRFLILSGNAVVAIYDSRPESKSVNVLNLFYMGEGDNDENQFLIFIPQNVLHGFCAIGNKPCGLLNFPTHIYDPNEEGRISFAEVGAKFSDRTLFSWNAVRDYFSKKQL